MSIHGAKPPYIKETIMAEEEKKVVEPAEEAPAEEPKKEEPKKEENKDLSYVSLRHVDKIYDNNVQAVFDFNLDIAKKEFIVFVGPSGCGKSTTLRMIAGLEKITAGDLFIDDTLVNDMEPKDRDIAMVFQNYALYPHMTVYGNMAFALKLRKIPCPLYEPNVDINLALDENKELMKQAKKLRKKAQKKNENNLKSVFNKSF